MGPKDFQRGGWGEGSFEFHGLVISSTFLLCESSNEGGGLFDLHIYAIMLYLYLFSFFSGEGLGPGGQRNLGYFFTVPAKYIDVEIMCLKNLDPIIVYLSKEVISF